MELYTGINMIKKIEGVDSKLLLHIPRYEEYIKTLRLHEHIKGCPSIECMMYILEIFHETKFNSEDEAYNLLHENYKLHIIQIKEIVQQLDELNVNDKYESIGLNRIKRGKQSALGFGVLFGFPKIYYRKLIDAEELKQKLQVIGTDDFTEQHQIFEQMFKLIDRYKHDYVFEVYVR